MLCAYPHKLLSSVVMSVRTSYLTVATVAEMLSVSELTVRRKIRSGDIPAVKLSTAGRGARAHPRGCPRGVAAVG